MLILCFLCLRPGPSYFPKELRYIETKIWVLFFKNMFNLKKVKVINHLFKLPCLPAPTKIFPWRQLEFRDWKERTSERRWFIESAGLWALDESGTMMQKGMWAGAKDQFRLCWDYAQEVTREPEKTISACFTGRLWKHWLPFFISGNAKRLYFPELYIC